MVIDPWEREKIIYRDLEKASMVNFNFIQRGLEDIKTVTFWLPTCQSYPLEHAWNYSTQSIWVKGRFAYAESRIQAHG